MRQPNFDTLDCLMGGCLQKIYIQQNCWEDSLNYWHTAKKQQYKIVMCITNPVFRKTKTGDFICTNGLGNIFNAINYSKFDPQKNAFWSTAGLLFFLSRSSRLQMYKKRSVFKISQFSQENNLCWSLFFKKLQVRRPVFLSKWNFNRRFSVNIAKFLRTAFL